ncbi:MAG: DUF1570 domain-containing protein [Planctomycetota bacterium]
MKQTLVTLLLSAAMLAGASDLHAQDSAAFEKGMASVERAMDKGQWGKASNALVKLLGEHEKQRYVYVEKQRILQDMERIALFQEYEAPDADDVLAGKVKKYDAEKGKIEIQWDQDSLSDWEPSGDIFNLPVTMMGQYTIELTGDHYPTSNPVSVVTGWGTEQCLIISMGDDGHLPTIALRKDERSSEFLDTSEKQPMKLNKPFKILIEVKNNKVTVKADKKKLMDCKRQKGEYGRLAFYGLDDFERESLEITLKAEIEPSWVAGKIDAVMQNRRTEFETSYDASKHLPEWLFEEMEFEDETADDEEAGETDGSLRGRASSGSRVADASGPTNFHLFPGEELDGVSEGIAEDILIDFLAGDIDLEEAQGEIREGVVEGDYEQVVADFLNLFVFRQYGLLEDAAAAGRKVLAVDPDHQPTILMQAMLLARLRNLDEARTMLEDARKRWPQSGAVVESLVDVEILDQKLEVAQRLVKEARADGLLGKEGEALQARLDKAVSGPHWPKTHRHESRYYDVQSDISKDICKEAARMLESAYNSYSIHLAKVKGLEKNKFRVFLFSGEASYHRYASDSFGSSRENTAGLFSPFLKQLLIWNVPSRESMMRTIVHEGFHQYLDQIAPETPRWFNEGMAEYFELYETVNGKFTEGQVNPNHVEMLLQKSIPLRHFLNMPAGAFYRGDVSLHYAQGWGFVHFLRNSGREEKQLFDALFQGFADSPSSGKVLEEVLADVDMTDLERRFRDHIKSLRGK